MSQHTPNIIGAGALARNVATILRKVAGSDQESFVVTHNKPKVVIMSVARYEELKALEELEFIPHRKTSPAKVRASFAQTGLYRREFLDDLEEGLKQSSIYSK